MAHYSLSVWGVLQELFSHTGFVKLVRLGDRN